MRNIFFLLAISLFASCGNSADAPNAEYGTAASTAKAWFERGKVIRVACQQDSTQQYALYLPSGYDTLHRWPVVFLFDPHASGDLPLNLYKNIAEKHQFILAGSFRSENGQDENTSMHIAASMMSDAGNRLMLDSTRIAIAGFSGGARVAGSVALAHPEADVVIGCSAGISSREQTAPAFAYIGIAGKGDMNALEMIRQEEMLRGTSMRHALLLFDGKHNWPPESLMDEAFELNACFSGDAASQQKAAQAYTTRQKQQASSLLVSDPNEAELILRNASAAAPSDTSLSGMLSRLMNSAAWKNASKAASDIQTKELKLQEEFVNHMLTGNEQWWNAELAKLDTLHEQNKPLRLMYMRMYGYASLMAYSYTNRMLQSNDLVNAAQTAWLYRKVDPANSEAQYFSAVISARKKDGAAATAYLKEAIKQGFKDKTRLSADTSFAFLINDATYRSVTAQIK